MLVHLDCSIGYYVMEIIFCYFSESDVNFISFEYFRIRSVFGYRVSNHLSHIIAFHVLRVLSVIRWQVYWKLPRKREAH